MAKTMTPECRKTIKGIIGYFDYKCTVETFKKYKYKSWFSISEYQTLSEDFIREFQDRVYWPWIAAFQELSEDFIREFQDKVNWGCLMKSNTRINFDKFYDVFFLDFHDKIKQFGNEKQIEKLQEIEKHIIDRTYDIIL